MNLRRLGYEHANRRLSPLPWPPLSLHLLGRAGTGVSSAATRAETYRHVLVTGLVTVGPYSVLILSQTPDAPPRLTITPSGGAVNLEWPGVYSEWVLLTSATLDDNPSWSQVPSSQYQTNASTISVTLAPTGTSSFYRLQKL